MLEYDRIDVSKRTDVNKTDGLHECIICHYGYVLEKNVKFHLEVCNGYHDLIQKAVSFNDPAIASVK